MIRIFGKWLNFIMSDGIYYIYNKIMPQNWSINFSKKKKIYLTNKRKK